MENKVEQAKLILRDYVNTDRQIRSHRKETDFEQFCETTCVAIEIVLEQLETYENYFKGFKDKKV